MMCNDFEIQHELVFCLWHKFFEEEKKKQSYRIKLTFSDSKFNLTGMLNHLVSDLGSQIVCVCVYRLFIIMYSSIET